MLRVLLVSLVLGQGFAPARQGTEPLNPEQEARVLRLGKKLRCAVCQGVAISDSPASMAQAQLDKVRELVREGKTDDEIFTYFVARYGEWVLLEPTKEGANAALWLGPVLLLLVGAGLIIFFARERELKDKTAPAPAPAAEEKPTGDAAEDPYLAAVRADLEK